MLRALENQFTKLLHIPEKIVDGMGMYRVVSLTLIVLVLIGFGSALAGLLVYSPQAQLTSLLIVLAIGLGLNALLAAIWRVSPNHESALITALIVFFLCSPNADIVANWVLASAISLAIISKYLIVYRKQHILNPAALGAVLVALIVTIWNISTGSTHNTDLFGWWVGNPILFWPVLIFGTLIVFKVRKWTPVLWFVGVGLAVFLLESIRFEQPLLESVEMYFFSFPTLFLAFVMLTEPFTMPPTKTTQAMYGGLVGVLSSTAIFAPYIAMTPELALVAGNCFAYGFRSRQKLILPLIEKREIATGVWEFVFKKPDSFTFKPGQYLEWMLPHRPTDSRGLRRYFTIASSPTESVIRMACKILPDGGSAYKKNLKQLDEGELVVASQLAGDFLLPADADTKLGMIAGGIGVTPFSSHLRWMQDSGKKYDTALYYCCNTMADRAFLSDFKAMDLPLQIVPVLAKEESADKVIEHGFVNVEMLDRRTPDWRERTWYLSGPPGMVNAYYKLMRDQGIPKKQIKKDFFPGLA